MIIKIADFLDDDQINSLLDLTNELPPHPGSDTGDKSTKKSTVYDDVTFPGSGAVTSKQRRRIHDIVFRKQESIDEISDKVTCGEFDNIFSSIAVYNTGDFYEWHLDRLTTGQGKSIDIAYTIFLNDPKEYYGGELLVKHEFGGSSFKESAGTIVFYPSASLHCVDMILEGTRKVVLGLINCTVSSSHDRHLLTELSNSINDIDRMAGVLSNAMIDRSEIDKINHNLHYVQMQLQKRFMKH